MRKILYKHAWSEVKQLWKDLNHLPVLFQVFLAMHVLLSFWLLILVRPKWYLRYILFLHDWNSQEVLT